MSRVILAHGPAGAGILFHNWQWLNRNTDSRQDSLDVLETTVQTSVIPPILKYHLIVTL